MNKILLSFVTGVSLCGASAFAMDFPSPFSTDDAHRSLRLQPQRPMGLERKAIVLSTLDHGIFSEPKEYLVNGRLLKEILESVDESNASRSNWENMFELEIPDYESGSYDSNGFQFTEYYLFDRQNLDKERCPEIRDYMSFNAKPGVPSQVTHQTYSWTIQGYYPTGENFSLKIAAF